MTEHRCKPTDLCMAESMPWQQHHECRTILPIASLLNPTFFLNVRANLRAGDKVTICRYENERWQRLVEVAEVRVVAIEPLGVPLQPILHIDFSAAPKAAPAPPPPPPAPERYATSSGWKAVHLHFGQWNVVDEAGNVVASKLDKETAHSVARGDLPVPAQQAA